MAYQNDCLLELAKFVLIQICNTLVARLEIVRYVRVADVRICMHTHTSHTVCGWVGVWVGRPAVR